MSVAEDIQAVLDGTKRHCVIEGDCLTVMPMLGDKSVGVICTDPPYHARAMRNARSNGEVMRERRDGVIYEFGYSALSADVREAASLEFGRLAQRWVMPWTDIESDHLWRGDLEAAGLEYIRLGLWHRTNSAPQFSGDRPSHCVEAFPVMHPPGRKRWNGGGRSAFYSHAIVPHQDDSREHSTPKPLPLMLEQVADFTDPDELILDPFCGSGTTGVACLRLGRRFIGIEKDARHAAIARERLAAEDRGLSLRDVRAGQTSIFDLMKP